MAQRTDLYSILVSYANKNNSPYIEIDNFLGFLGRYAKKHSEEQPEWLKWVNDRSAKFWSEISVLIEEGRCELLADTDSGRVYMPQFYLELLNKAYTGADEYEELLFPCEESLRITLPDDQFRLMNSEQDLIYFLEEAAKEKEAKTEAKAEVKADDEEQDPYVPIVKIKFADGFGEALVLDNMIPRRLTEMAILKIRNYLRKGGNKEYTLHKLAPQLQGKESFLRDYINQIMVRPMECCNAIEGGGEFSYLFWAHFCILIRNDLKKKKEYTGEDIASYQAVFIIDAVNGYYKSLAVKARETELALKSLENHLAKPPYLYTLEEILKFTNSKGVLLLGQYSGEDLEEWIRKKTTESENNELPVLLIMQNPGNERGFLFKEKILALCFKLISEARGKVKDEVNKHWRRLLLDYQNEAAMDNDGEFEKYLQKLTVKLCPALAALLEDPKLLLVYDEMERSDNGVPPAVKIFNKGQLIPYSALLLVNRKELLSQSKIVLPFWYSMPIITAIIAFFKDLGRKRKAPRLSASPAAEEEQGSPAEKDRAGEIRSAAGALELSLVPPGYTLDSYLEELESRWSRLIDRQARENLIEDVKSLIRDNLRRNLKLQKNFKLTQEIINQMAENIVIRTPTLASLGGRDSLILYAVLYLVKLLENIK